MDWIGYKKQIVEYIVKYRNAIVIVLAGIFLMMLPGTKEQKNQEPQKAEQIQVGLEESLAEILSHLSGAGTVEVLLTQAEGEKIIFQTDEELSADKKRNQAVLITNSDREETGLVRQINPPKYLGAIVACQGADNAAVRLAIVEAVVSVTGLTSDRITVLKMK